MMSQLGEVQRAVRSRVARVIAPKISDAPSPAAFYPSQPSCQVPNLSFLFSRFLGDRTDGSFVEVGAFDGVFVSNTWGLAERGWRGLMAEPVPALAAQCRRNHVSHPAVNVVETAIGPAGTTEVTLYVAGTLTTANSDAFEEYAGVDWAAGALTDEQITVRSQTLDELLESEGANPDFDVLVVDVEGFEAQVFSSFDVARWRPRMMIVELVDTHPDLALTASSDAHLGRALVGAGYVVVFKDHINTVFVREDVWSGAFATATG